MNNRYSNVTVTVKIKDVYVETVFKAVLKIDSEVITSPTIFKMNRVFFPYRNEYNTMEGGHGLGQSYGGNDDATIQAAIKSVLPAGVTEYSIIKA